MSHHIHGLTDYSALSPNHQIFSQSIKYSSQRSFGTQTEGDLGGPDLEYIVNIQEKLNQEKKQLQLDQLKAKTIGWDLGKQISELGRKVAENNQNALRFNHAQSRLDELEAEVINMKEEFDCIFDEESEQQENIFFLQNHTENDNFEKECNLYLKQKNDEHQAIKDEILMMVKEMKKIQKQLENTYGRVYQV